MSEQSRSARRPPKPKLPTRGRAAVRGDQEASPKDPRRRVTTAEVADKLDRLTASVQSVEQALAPRERSGEVEAEEHALLNLVDAIVDRRTDQVLLPLAHLVTLLDRLVACPDPEDQRPLLLESTVQLDAVLQSLGLERIAPVIGDESDPWLHEEVDLVTDCEIEPGLVVRLVRPGVRVRGGKTLIPALVAVSGSSE